MTGTALMMHSWSFSTDSPAFSISKIFFAGLILYYILHSGRNKTLGRLFIEWNAMERNGRKRSSKYPSLISLFFFSNDD